MAGDEDRDAIGGASRCRRAHGFRLSDALGYIRIAHDIAFLDPHQKPPHPNLKRRAAQIERQIRPGPPALK